MPVEYCKIYFHTLFASKSVGNRLMFDKVTADYSTEVTILTHLLVFKYPLRVRMQARRCERHCLTASSLRSDATLAIQRRESGCGTHDPVTETEIFCHRYLKINNSTIK